MPDFARPAIPPFELPCRPERADEFIAAPSPAAIRTLRSHTGPILVLGAGGKLGLHVAYMLSRAARAQGLADPVLAVSRFRTLRTREEFERLGLATLGCDLEDDAALRALPDAATVFFLAGVKFGTASNPDLLRRMNVEMPRRVAERFRRSRIVVFSSGAVYPFAPVGSQGATEATQREPVGEYAASCAQREKAFEEASRRHGTKAVLIRLNYAVEFRYGVLVDIAQRVMRGEPIDVTMGRLNLIWQGDAISHAIQALELAAAPAVPLNVTGPRSYAVRELAERFGGLFGAAPRLNGREADTAVLSDASKAIGLFGEPKVSLEQMIAWTAAWLREVGQTWRKPTGFEVRDGAY
ncbi:MAG: NAD-dependent epimerase/dehydratase family protein [Opitutaceae bacterium]